MTIIHLGYLDGIGAPPISGPSACTECCGRGRQLDLTTTKEGKGSMNASGNSWLLTVAKGACDSDCRTALHQLRQLHVLWGKETGRVKRSLVELGAADPDPSLLRDYLEVSWFGGRATALMPGVNIVDPLGNVVLRYARGGAGKPVR